MLHLDRDLLAVLAERSNVHLRQRRRANRLRLERREQLVDRLPRIGQEHLAYRLDRRPWAFILQRDERRRPLQRQQITHAAQMLAQLDEDRAVFLEHAECALRAALVAGLDRLVAFFRRGGLLVEGFSVAGREING